MSNVTKLAIAAVILLAAIYALFAFDVVYPDKVDDFATCAAAGNAVMESYPRQCRDKEGDLFVEEIAKPVGEGKGCKPTGCSGQICSDEDVMSTCEFRAEYACYKTAKCERQADGKCGWTNDAALASCLVNPPQE